ncbi:hypothetical protein BDW59DRAFT_181736 [Aspergillus cavernicola]|uniref:Uncharacterized protein n=1 Tax=Aspergillus cavernicola TaxID=176166 RepID=A0ABR4HWF3_9EURO
MTSIQRIAANGVQITPEVNFALFNGNFDFSLYKCDAPAELVLVGERLSKQRRELAEEGSLHILARRLRFLFEGVFPSVPSLLKAYGTRASEIVRELDKAGCPSGSIVNGIFGPHLGVDSTSIWAGATSGGSGLLMHLLACMLARIWSPQEATAIWAELIDQRRRVVKDQTPEDDSSNNFFARQAAAYETEWASIQSWDSSARAWLQIADNSSLKRQQKQIELIANNLSVAIQTQVTSDSGVTGSILRKDNTYDSVIMNFSRALSTMEDLIMGRPQRILDGGVLLGLTSWQLYPDLVLLGPKTQEIFQKDSLISPSGIATLSISYQEDPHGNQDGVYWSLPLASLRYYGTVQCKRSSLHDSKLTFAQLQALILGASLDSVDTLPIAGDILKSLWTLGYASIGLNEYPQSKSVPHDGFFQLDMNLKTIMPALHLLSPLIGGVDLVSSNIEGDQKIALQLIKYGANCARSWIGSSSTVATSFFGVTDPTFVLKNASTPEVRVTVLRALCEPLLSESDAFIIRFKTDNGSCAFASLAQHPGPSGRKRNRNEFESEPEDEEWVFLSSKNEKQYPVLTWQDEYNLEDLKEEAKHYNFSSFVREDWRPRVTVVWELFIGIHNLAAVYIRRGRATQGQGVPLPTVPLPVIRNLLHNRCLDVNGTMECITGWFAVNRPSHQFSLLALGRIIEHYKSHLPYITLSMSIIKQAPETWTWAKTLVNELEIQQLVAASHARAGLVTDSLYPSPLTREQAFASILQFESGSISLDVHELNSVMAISSGNSLFIAQRILHDPIPPEGLASCAVAHAIGNVGKPGIALLFAPDKPNIREHDVERWQVVNHNPFDDNPVGGLFDGSSLQMSFTGWVGPLRVRGPSAFRGMEAYNLETQISMYDRGEWVADLNILKALGSCQGLQACELLKERCGHNPAVAHSGVQFVSVDCWEVLLSPSDKPMVLRSGSSWMARMTGVCIAYSRGLRCFLLPPHEAVCWTCVVDEADIRDLGGQKILFIY